MALSSTSRSLFLLGLLLVSGFALTAANACGRSLLETSNKLAVGGLHLNAHSLDQLLLSKHGLIYLVVTVDVSAVVDAVELLLEGAAGDMLDLQAVKGPILVKVSVSGTVNIVVKALGKKVHVSLQLSKLDPVLELVGDLVHVVLKLVEKVEKGLHVVQILDPVTKEVLELIPGEQ